MNFLSYINMHVDMILQKYENFIKNGLNVC